MRGTLFIAALICAPLTAFGQNVSDTVQVGENNQLVTVQSGNNVAVTRQFGSANRASITQMGKHNVAAVAQIGNGLSRDVVQTGNYEGYGSVQITGKVYGSYYSGTGGNAFTSTTLEFSSAP